MTQLYSAGLTGIDAVPITVEIEATYGLRSFTIVGLPDKAVEEARERVAAALRTIPIDPKKKLPRKILVNLAPANVKKEGSHYDLPIAIGYLITTQQIPELATQCLMAGELSLHGALRPIRGAIAMADAARTMGYTEVIVPKANAKEAALISGVSVIGCTTLREVVSYLRGETIKHPTQSNGRNTTPSHNAVHLMDIGGHHLAKRALHIAATGGHNILMTGPPGSGKTLLAKAIPQLLPKLSQEEALEVTRIYSATNQLSSGGALIAHAPFRAPHHTASEAALLGGGHPVVPGEITLAHHGVLFLDELPEFHRDVLESLRQPLEEGVIHIARAKARHTFPANCMLVAAANPCPCGYLHDAAKECTCTTSQIQKYQRKLSGPLIDRIDMHIEVPAQSFEKLTDNKKGQALHLQQEVRSARTYAQTRGSTTAKNTDMTVPDIKKHCLTDTAGNELLKQCVNQRVLSGRGYHRVLKVARTIADLASSPRITKNHVAEALSYRLPDRSLISKTRR